MTFPLGNKDKESKTNAEWEEPRLFPDRFLGKGIFGKVTKILIEA